MVTKLISILNPQYEVIVNPDGTKLETVITAQTELTSHQSSLQHTTRGTI
jgi:hypothetical protein